MVEVDLAAQPGDVDVDDVVEGGAAGRLAPHLARQRVARDDLAGVAGQVVQQVELLRGQLDGLPVARDPAGRPVDLERVDGQAVRVAHPSAAGDGAESGEQLGERERLHQVVVGPRVEPDDPVLQGVPRRQHHHRRVEPLLAQGRENLEAVAPRQHQVEQDDLEPVPREAEEGALAGGLDHHVVPLAFEALAQGPGDLLLVLDDEQAAGRRRPRPLGGPALQRTRGGRRHLFSCLRTSPPCGAAARPPKPTAVRAVPRRGPAAPASVQINFRNEPRGVPQYDSDRSPRPPARGAARGGER